MSTEAEKPSLIARVVNSVEGAISKLRREKLTQEQQAAKEQADMRREYVALVCRSDNPKSADETRLVELITALGMDTATLQRDARTVEELKGWIADAAVAEERGVVSSEALEVWKATLERHKQELADTRRLWDRARGAASRSQEAVSKLNRSYHQHAEFFGSSLLPLPAGFTPPAPPEPPTPVRVVPQVMVNVAADGYPHWIEPVVGEDGHYTRNERGKYLMPGGEYSK